MILNVLYVFDDAYAPYAGVSIHSLIRACGDIPEIHIWCLCLRVSQENGALLEEEVARAGRPGVCLHVVNAVDVERRIVALGLPSYRDSYAANMRLFFDEFLPPEADTVLYLDCDTLVLRSLSSLLTLAGTLDEPVAAVRESICGQYYRYVGFRHPHRYFNSGVLLFTPVWRREHWGERLLDFLKNNPVQTMNPDQDCLNRFLAKRFFLLPPCYNFQPVHLAFDEKAYFSCYPQESYYTAGEIAASRENIVILHAYRFCGQSPWHAHSVHPAAALWQQNKQDSAFCDTNTPPQYRNLAGLLFSLERVLYRVLPRRVFLKLFAACQKHYQACLNRRVRRREPK